eukprot:GHVU01034184.1.p1 GENE.GHVU01034184.1~~GHVU01034184.1.p1  ORF type:complete len:613 (+),score=132.88 GHVU01034184.1:200-1840(+)
MTESTNTTTTATAAAAAAAAPAGNVVVDSESVKAKVVSWCGAVMPLLEVMLQLQYLMLCAELGAGTAAEFEGEILPVLFSAAAQSGTTTTTTTRTAEVVKETTTAATRPDYGKVRPTHSARLALVTAFCERHKRLLNVLVKTWGSAANPSTALSVLLRLYPIIVAFETKREYFRQRLKASREGRARPDVLSLRVRRNMVFLDSYRQLMHRNKEEMRGKIVVECQGEQGIDQGGLTREWFSILAREMFNPGYALFCRCGEKAEFNHPNALSHVNDQHLSYFRFIGRVIGKALYDGQHISAYFTRSVYKHMLGRKTAPVDAECLDPEFYKNLLSLLLHPLEALGLELHFANEVDAFGKTKVVDLKPDGHNILVTDANKEEYVKLVCEHKITDGIQDQLQSFLEGFHELIPMRLLSIFDDKELELMLSGLPHIDLKDLRANTEYSNYSPDDQVIRWFWEVLGELGQTHLASFLQFITGTSRVPLGGFRTLQGVRGPQKFKISKAYGTDHLPASHTCVNQLDLPEYDTKEVLEAKLLKAITEGKEGFGLA